ncbi:glycoside hydrolase family 16 protein, partial [Ephemerocybe angulata]
NGINQNPNGSLFIWVPEDEYAGQTFYDGFSFFNNLPDPTNSYVNESYARAQRLVYVQDDGKVIMKADDQTTLAQGAVRIESNKKYDGGLFILDLNRAPWGCGVWPAFWTVGDNWPSNGEIDVIEGVHDNQHNQVAFHTAPGCLLDSTANFTGTISDGGGYQHLDCNSLINSNAGCGATEWSRASYGPLFDEQGGGIFAMKWDENGIAVWSFFRAAVPPDVAAGTPNPSTWGPPSANLSSSQCDIGKYFMSHAIVFDITFCGDWAGNSYATSGCPGTCDDRLMDPANFVNATWSINSLKVFKKQPLYAQVANSASSSMPTASALQRFLTILSPSIYVLFA